MMKRILALTLAILMAMTLMVTAQDSDVQIETVPSELTEAEKFFIGIGAIHADTYNPDEVLTRAEFAEFLVQIAKLNTVAPDGESVFVDVPVTHKNYSAIKAVHSYGLMGGIGDSKFAPDYNIYLNQVIKVMVDLLGYKPYAEREGGYPGGYITIATKQDILKNVSGAFTENATYKDVLQIFYNALEVEVYAANGATDDGVIHGPSGETFAESVLKLTKVEGRVTDNGLTSLAGASNINENEMMISGVKVDLSEEVAYARDYIGMNVEAYFRNDADYGNPLAYIQEGKNDSLTFDLADFVSITQSKITYYNGSKNVSKSLANGFVMIYNGKIFDPIIPSSLENVDGEVTLVSTGKNGYDLIIVNAYENIYVESIDKTEKVIYNGIKYKPGYTGTTVLDFNDENTYDFLNVVTHEGVQSSFDKIREGDVLSAKISRDGRVITLIDRRKFTQTFVLENYEVIDNVCTITDGEEKYEILHFNKIALPDLIPGEKYTVHFNNFGKAVWMEKATAKLPAAFLAGAESSGGQYTKDYKVLLYTTDGEMITLTLDERVYYNNFRKKTEDIFSELSTYIGSAVLYEEDSGVLTRIVMPEELGVESGRGWYRISPKTYGCQADSGLSDADWSAHKTNTWSGVGEWRHVGDKFAFVNGTTVGMYVPPEKANYGNTSGYGIFKTSPKSSTKKAIEGYSYEFDDVVADLQLVKVEGTSMSSTGMDMLLISEITTRSNDEGELVKVVNGYKTSYGTNGVSRVSYAVSEDAVVSGCTMNDIDDVSAGDIMMFSLNGDDELTTLEIFYDYSTGISESILHGSYHVAKGYIYSNGDNWTRITTVAPESLDMTNDADYMQTVGRYHNYSNSLIIVTDVDGRLFFDTAKVSDLKSYKKTYGEYDYLVTINNGSESIFGSVAYR